MQGNFPRGFPAREDIPPSRAIRYGLIAGAVVIVLALLTTTVVQVDATEACAVTRFGEVTGVAGPGLHVRVPGVTQYRCFRTATTYYEVLEEGASATNADYTSGPVDGVTIDGQQLLLTFNVRYRVDASRVSDIYENIGKTPGEINERVVKFHTRSISRQIANTKRADELYLGNLAVISSEMLTAIQPRFTEAGLILEFFELKRPNFSDAYEQAIESRQIAEVQIEQRRQEALVAEQEAERVRNEAQGQADANVIRAQGEAQALGEQGRAVRENPEILELERIRALASANVIYVPSSGILPVLDLGGSNVETPTDAAAPAPTSAPILDPPVTPTPEP